MRRSTLILECPQMTNVPGSIFRIFQTGLYDNKAGKQWYGIDTRCAKSRYDYSEVASKQGTKKTYYKAGETFSIDRGHLNPSGKWKPVSSELLWNKSSSLYIDDFCPGKMLTESKKCLGCQWVLKGYYFSMIEGTPHCIIHLHLHELHACR